MTSRLHPWLLSFCLLACSDRVAYTGPGGSPTPPPPDSIAEDIFGARQGDPVGFASAEQLATFERGREVAEQRFVPETGLGPHFNVVSCAACHEKPVVGGGAGRYRDFFLVGQSLSDGSFLPTGVNGVQPHYTLAAAQRQADDAATNTSALRNPIPFFGVGLIAELSEESILANSDPDDQDNDGISGRPNYDEGFVGRFGRKSQTVSIEGFIRGPLFNHMGVTSNPLSNARKNELPVPSGIDESDTVLDLSSLRKLRLAQAAAPAQPTLDDDGVADPELSPDALFDLVSFSMLLAPPKPDELNAETEIGSELFGETGCNDCHVRTLKGPRGLIPLYSDLLLHDMGPELADGIPMKSATGSEFRTQPLWGVASVGPYLHDGRADTLDEAIRMHAGEGDRARDAYEALSGRDQGRLVAFLESLGGVTQRSAGLLPPDELAPEIGAFGGPATELSNTDFQRFLKGRHLFDQERHLSEGLGTRFNGDSCRACHFDPVIGGSGTSDVDVTRQCLIDESGAFVDPPSGTMLHHQVSHGPRPLPDEQVNYFELRQTPPLFGLGLIERIPEAAIVALEDPDDRDGDGVHGIASRLVDGRLGRFGWKADVPSLAEFARDALSNELGLTLNQEAPFTFGRLSDDDDVSDPELGASDEAALVYFMQQLAPPPRGPISTKAKAGEQVFRDVGCATCHVPQLKTDDGVAVDLYSDLLVHEVLPMGAPGVRVGMANQRAFRTAPLWGISQTGPYLHNGRAFTLSAAIEGHSGEADASRLAFSELGTEQKQQLLAFLESL